MSLTMYQVDAFADRVFTGNPAAVCPLTEWLPDDTMLRIADENNLSETAFFVAEQSGYRLRWFTPEEEVDLCGHATLATAHVLFEQIGLQQEQITFYTRSGDLVVTKADAGYQMDFPATMPEAVVAPEQLVEALMVTPEQILAAYDYVVVLPSEQALSELTPDFTLLSKLDLRGVLVTAPGDEVDFVSRCFFPKLRIDEDPVTGSAHCELAPYWSRRLGKSKLIAKQLSKRTGLVTCEVVGERVFLTGSAVDYMQGTIFL